MIRQQNAKNFVEVFDLTTTCDKPPLSTYLNLDLFPEKYTIYPISVSKVDSFEFIAFDKAYTSPDDIEELKLMIFGSDQSLLTVLLNRNFRL